MPTNMVGNLQTYFDAAMARFLQEQQVQQGHQDERVAAEIQRAQVAAAQEAPRGRAQVSSQQTRTDVEMESVGTCEYDPDDMDLKGPAARIATAAAGQIPGMIPRIKLAATSDLKEFHGRNQDEDRARSWLSTVKTAFARDQAPDDEKCLVFGGLLTGPAQNWYRQLGRSVRSSWKDVTQEFQMQFCGLGVPVARQYYHAKKRPEESTMDYLYRLNVIGLRAKIKIKDGPPKIQKEHVEHYIETLDDPELADQLTMLRLADVDELEDVLRARQRTKARRGKVLFGSSKFRQKAPVPPDRPREVNRRSVHAVRATLEESSSEASGSDSSGDDGDQRRMYVMAMENQKDSVSRGPRSRPAREADQHHRQEGDQGPRGPPAAQYPRCAHCGSRKHGDLDCWKCFTCDHCGKRGHPTDRCLFVCKGCGETHESGKCPMEEFYNLIRQWYNPTKHAGMLPEKVEKMLN